MTHGPCLPAAALLSARLTCLLAGRFLRLSLSNMRARIPFEDLPNTRRLVGLCQDLYIARAEGELGLEEQLYWSLINV
jgi:hypothetical protein